MKPVVYFPRAYYTLFLCSPAPPRFTSKIQKSISIREGNKLSLNISTFGNPAPKITWSLQSRNHGNQSRFKTTAETFEIMAVRFEDQGKITCHAENVFGIRVVHVKLIVFGECVSLSVTLDIIRKCKGMLNRTLITFKKLEKLHTEVSLTGHN